MKDRYNTLEFYLWSDSQIVLYWINSNKQLQQFVANRVNSIKVLFPASTWHYCPTHENPAEILIRGLTTQQMLLSSLWHGGPLASLFNSSNLSNTIRSNIRKL